MGSWDCMCNDKSLDGMRGVEYRLELGWIWRWGCLDMDMDMDMMVVFYLFIQFNAICLFIPPISMQLND